MAKSQHTDETAEKSASSNTESASEAPASSSTSTDTKDCDAGPAMDFHTYAQIKKIPAHHAAGMLAHTELRTASLKAWDKAFADY